LFTYARLRQLYRYGRRAGGLPAARKSAFMVRGSSSLASRGDQRWARHDKPKDFQPVGRWRKAWSSRAQRRFKAVAGTTLIRAGDAKDHRW
jgi:hypothetical protein